MPLPKHPFVATFDEVKITRQGDDAIIEYADDAVGTTHLKIGAEKLAGMTDEELLGFWNDLLLAKEEHRKTLSYTATEIPVGQPQLKFHANSNQWTPRGQVVRCQILSDPGIEPNLDEPFVSIDGRDFTLAEFMTMVGSFGGWGMRIEFVPEDELHRRPRLKVRAPQAGKSASAFRGKRTAGG